MSTRDGLRAAAEAGLFPDAIYVDADHSFESVVADLTLALGLFPSAIIVGDDSDWEGVRKGVETVLAPGGLQLSGNSALFDSALPTCPNALINRTNDRSLRAPVRYTDDGPPVDVTSM